MILLYTLQRYLYNSTIGVYKWFFYLREDHYNLNYYQLIGSPFFYRRIRKESLTIKVVEPILFLNAHVILKDVVFDMSEYSDPECEAVITVDRSGVFYTGDSKIEIGKTNAMYAVLVKNQSLFYPLGGLKVGIKGN